MSVQLMYRVDIAFDRERGYAAAIFDVMDKKSKGIKASNIRQLCRLVHEAICEDEQRKRRFPFESEAQKAPTIITPGNGDPMFEQL